MGSYEQLESERTFAEKAYQHALEALDRSRMNADRQQVYVARFVQPSLPEEPLYPRRLRSVGIVFLIAVAVWLIGGFAVQTMREHLVHRLAEPAKEAIMATLEFDSQPSALSSAAISASPFRHASRSARNRLALVSTQMICAASPPIPAVSKGNSVTFLM